MKKWVSGLFLALLLTCGGTMPFSASADITPLQPPVVPADHGIIEKVKVLVPGDIRVAPTTILYL